MVSRQSRIEMSVGGVKKITLWKQSMVEGEQVWEECPNLPKPFLQTYLSRGFVESPPAFVPKPVPNLEPEPEPEVEETQTFAEAIASGKLDTDVRIKKKIGQSKKV